MEITQIFKDVADEMCKSRENCIKIHGNDIRAAGNEVEICVRESIRNLLPTRFFVSNGHLIDEVGCTSSQLDLIISDNNNLPSLYTTRDKTSYIPIDSTYAIGEIKSTYYKSEDYIKKFVTSLKSIKDNLTHRARINTALNGITNNSLMRDILLGSNRRILNSLFSFMIFVNSGDFDFECASTLFEETEPKYLPNIIIFLDKGVIFPGNIMEKSIDYNFYPEDFDSPNFIFTNIPVKDIGSLEGNHLSFLYLGLIDHLSSSFLEPPSFQKYLTKILHNNPMKIQYAKNQPKKSNKRKIIN